MIADYEARYRELTGEELTIYPADSRRILINVTAGKIYQLATIINERHKLNFLQYMYGDFLKNWASNFGFDKDGRESASVKLRFHLADAQKQTSLSQKERAQHQGMEYFSLQMKIQLLQQEKNIQIQMQHAQKKEQLVTTMQ